MMGFAGMVATFIVGAVVGALSQIAAAYIAADGTADAEGDKMAVIVTKPKLAKPDYLYDFVRCVGDGELEQLIQTINENGYDLVSVTQKGDTYTVFFRRYAP